MALELFRHNQEAYEASVNLLRERGKTAIIHPSGTDKILHCLPNLPGVPHNKPAVQR